MDVIISLMILGIILAAYLAPTLVAFQRQTSNRWSVGVINVFFGWTFIGWVIALAMSVSGAKPRTAIIQ